MQQPSEQLTMSTTEPAMPPYVPVEPTVQPNTYTHSHPETSQQYIPVTQQHSQAMQPYEMNQQNIQPYAQPYPVQPPHTQQNMMYHTPPTLPNAQPNAITEYEHKRMEKAVSDKKAQSALECLGAALLCIVCCPVYVFLESL